MIRKNERSGKAGLALLNANSSRGGDNVETDWKLWKINNFGRSLCKPNHAAQMCAGAAKHRLYHVSQSVLNFSLCFSISFSVASYRSVFLNFAQTNFSKMGKAHNVFCSPIWCTSNCRFKEYPPACDVTQLGDRMRNPEKQQRAAHILCLPSTFLKHMRFSFSLIWARVPMCLRGGGWTGRGVWF